MKTYKQNFVIYLMLTVFVGYCAFFVFPHIFSSFLIGFSGSLQGDSFVVTKVVKNSPADKAGFRSGDLVLTQDSKAIGDWYDLYQSDFNSYMRVRNRIPADGIRYQVQRSQSTFELTVIPRLVTGADIWRYYGTRSILVLLMFGLILFIILSGTRERSAFLFCLSFCFAMFWAVSEPPYRPRFFSPIISDVSSDGFSTIELIQLTALMVVLSTLLHIGLTFPRSHDFARRRRWILVLVYLIPMLVFGAILVGSEGGLLNRIAAVHQQRPWISSILLILAALFMVRNYRTSLSVTHREQLRWIVVAMVVVATFNIALWNLPILLYGKPLITDYDWFLVFVMLFPISMTISITNHHLFGIRGIIRGRIYMLEMLLDREKNLKIKREDYISDLVREVDQLKLELSEYLKQEFPPENTDSQQTSVLERIQKKYPQLERIRQERLIGRSRLWERVFEDAALAAQGIAPVMIVGESGTGKTDLAWAIYQMSERRDSVYKELSCAQFEHSDPAFALGKFFGIGSGHGLPNVPMEGQPGILQECDGGTLFLDDIDRLPLNVQDLLLYPLEGKPFEAAIGKGAVHQVSIKFIFATNRQPEALAADGKFQADVLARINARVNIPPLRDRPEDVPLLVEHLSKRISKDYSYEISVITPKAMKLLTDFPYRNGNVRELMSELQRAIGKVMLEDDHILRAGYLSDALQRASETLPSSSYPQVESNLISSSGESMELAVLKKNRFQIKPSETELGYSHKSRTMSNYLRGICFEALNENDWDPERAARSLVDDGDLQTSVKLERKINRFILNIKENIEKGTEKKLYNNLPTAYHNALLQTITQIRNKSL